MPKINSLEVVHQDTNKDSYQNLHDILVELNKSLALNKEVVDGDARASIENLLEMYVNDKEAFLRSVQTLTAEFKESKAQFSQEILLKASELEALARKTTMLTAQTANNIASVKEYSEAVASEVDRKVSTYSQDDPPTDNLTYGDLWYDTNDNNKLYRWNGIAWVDISDTSGLEAFIAGQYATDYAAIESQVDSKAETWFQTSDPSTAWTAQAIKDQHDKDLWYNSTTKLLKIYTASSNTWTTVQDQAAIDAADAASTAQSTADGKITTFIQTSAPTAEGVGDLWLDSDDNRKMYRWNGTSWVAVDDSRIATTYARWGVQVDANDYVAGIQLNADNTGTSEFTVLADNFRVFGSSKRTNPIFATQVVPSVTATVSSVSTATETITTTASHGFSTGQEVLFTGTIGGLTTNTYYYIISVATNQFKVATTRENALAGTAQNLTSAGSGSRTFTYGGSKVTINGDLVITGSIMANSVSVPAKFSLAAPAFSGGSSYTNSFYIPDAAYVSILVTAVQPNDNGLYVNNAGNGYTYGASAATTHYPASIATQFTLTLDGTVVFNETPNNSFGVVTSFSASKQITSSGTKSFTLSVTPSSITGLTFVDTGCVPRDMTVYVLASAR